MRCTQRIRVSFDNALCNLSLYFTFLTDLERHNARPLTDTDILLSPTEDFSFPLPQHVCGCYLLLEWVKITASYIT